MVWTKQQQQQLIMVWTVAAFGKGFI